MSYFNTTNERGDTLKRRKRKTENQDDIVLAFFRQHKEVEISPSECWINAFQADETPITSVRRSINTLTREGKLIKTENKKIGVYGKPEYLWKYNYIMPKP